MKKIAALLLALLMVTPLLVACQDDKDPVDTDPADTTKKVEDTTVDDGPALEVPDVTFDGATYDVLCGASEWFNAFEVAHDEIEGDIVSQAVYDRNVAVEDRFDVDVVYHEFSGWATGTEARQQALNESVSETGFYESMVSAVASTGRHILTNVFSDLNKNEYLDLDKPWWFQFINDQLQINGALLHAASHLSYNNTGGANAIFFNKQVQSNKNIEDIYQLVYDDKWTVDKMMELAEAASEDVNNDGMMTDEDVFGVVSKWDMMGGLLHGLGYNFTYIDDEGMTRLVGGTELAYDVNAKLQQIVTSSYYGDIEKLSPEASNNAWAETRVRLFAEDHTLFMTNGISASTDEYLRNMEDYGIAPCPKLNEDQANYYSFVSSETSAIMAYVEDEELAGVITEALAYYSYKILTPAYFEKALGEKLARDPDMQKMLNIINETASSDWAYLYYSCMDTNLFFAPIRQPNLASWFGQNKTRYETMLNRFTESVGEMLEE